MNRAMVLGATGFIGGHVARAALAEGWSVTGVRRRPDSVGNIGDLPIEWLQADLQEESRLRSAMAGAEVVFHAAGYYPHSSRHVADQVADAVRQTRGVLQAARLAGVRRFIYTSSLTTIGRPPADAARLADERDHYLPGSVARSAYYECKYAMESEVLRAAAAGFPAIVLNPTAVLGPGDVHLTMARILVALAGGRGLAWFPAETNVVDVRDCAAAHVAAALRGRVGERYLIGGHNLTVRDLMQEIAEVCGVPAPRWRVPVGVIDTLVRFGDLLPGPNQLGNHLRAVHAWQGYDCAKAASELGLAPRPLAETLQAAIGWLRATGYLAPHPTMVR